MPRVYASFDVLELIYEDLLDCIWHACQHVRYQGLHRVRTGAAEHKLTDGQFKYPGAALCTHRILQLTGVKQDDLAKVTC